MWCGANEVHVSDLRAFAERANPRVKKQEDVKIEEGEEPMTKSAISVTDMIDHESRTTKTKLKRKTEMVVKMDENETKEPINSSAPELDMMSRIKRRRRQAQR